MSDDLITERLYLSCVFSDREDFRVAAEWLLERDLLYPGDPEERATPDEIADRMIDRINKTTLVRFEPGTRRQDVMMFKLMYGGDSG